jgi:hypothetical protein
MNRFLASGLGIINVMAAIIIVLLSTMAGIFSGLEASDLGEALARSVAGGTLGLVLGVFWACLICGLIATLIGIYSELRSIRQHLHASNQLPTRGPVTTGSGSRNEPQVL